MATSIKGNARDEKIHDQWARLSRGLARRDPLLAPVIKKIGKPQLTLESDAFRALARAILGQQLAVKAAEAISKRFAALSPPFPKPGWICEAPIDQLRAAGLSGSKAGYLVALAEAWQNPKWRRGWPGLSDAALVERLVQVKGVGEWTAHMFLIFSLGRPDVLPTGDFGVRRGIQLLHGLKEIPKPKEVLQWVGSWKGAASVASWYVWRGLDEKLIGNEFRLNTSFSQ